MAMLPKPATLRTIMPKPTTTALRLPLQQSRAFALSAPGLKKHEVVRETEVPVSVYAPDSKGVAEGNSDHFSIPVEPTPVTTPPEEVEQEEEKVIPLTPEVFSAMPPTMQKLTVMGKVIVITG